MSSTTDFERIYAIIVAAGRGSRIGTKTPKQLLPYGGRTILETAVRKFAKCDRVSSVIAVSPPDGSLDDIYEKLLRKVCPDVRIVRGGDKRSDSVLEGLKAAAEDAANHGISADRIMVLIHDAARPGVDAGIIERGIEAMKTCRAVTTAVPSVDSVRMISDTSMKSLKTKPSYPIITSANVQRELVYNVQTPQIFVLEDIMRAHETALADGFIGTDDASYAEHIGIDVGIVEGSRANAKITTAEDLKLSVRVGNGYDVHRLVPGRDLILCGTPIPAKLGLDGHSDADVATHALMDALLGAAGLGDIGRHFPDTDVKYKGANSLELLARVKEMLGGWSVGNVDITIVAQAPKLAPYNEQMRENIANTLGIPMSAVNVKATTEEGLGFTGREEGIAAFAVCTIEGSL